MLKWSFNACFAHCSFVRNKKTNEIWVLCTFCAPIELFFGGTALVSACSFFGPNFFKNHEPCAHDAHIIFLFYAIILISVLAPSFKLIARRCSLFDVG